MKFIIEKVSDLRWVDERKTAIDMQLKLLGVPDCIPFCAVADDQEAHGRMLFERAASGELGPVADYVPPTPLEAAAQHNPSARADAMARAIAEARHCEMMCDWDTAQAWRAYYQQLHALENEPEWPQVVSWPTPPGGAG